VNERGFIRSTSKQRNQSIARTATRSGDHRRDPMLAHQRMHEGKVAAENIAGHKAFSRAADHPVRRLHRSRSRMDGLTETQAKAAGRRVREGILPWAASGRAGSVGRPEGATKVLLDPKTRRILGHGHRRVNAGELIAGACWRWRWARTWKTSA